MKIAYYSDLHLEFGGIKNCKKMLQQVQADVIVIAGDLIDCGTTAAILHRFDDIVTVPLLYVPGNHDYYHTSKEKLDIELAEHQFQNVHILNTKTIVLHGVRFIGATGWWTNCSRRSRISINDFCNIQDITIHNHGIRWGELDRAFFEAHLVASHYGTTVCISHHAPSFSCIPQNLRNRLYNDVYANNWDGMLLEYAPALWIHGHIHQQSSDFTIGATRVVSNPYGYHRLGRINPDFSEVCIITL